MNRTLYTQREYRSLRFYQGDTASVCAEGASGSFYAAKSAYRTLNALMYDGIENERTRIFHEHRQLHPQLLADVEEILRVYKDIFTIMKWETVGRCGAKREPITTYRAERKQALDSLKNGYTVSFTSTSKNETTKEAFSKKDGLVLLSFTIPAGIPFVEMNEVLGDDNPYSEQEEVLLPPFLRFTAAKARLRPEEAEYRDMNGKPPVGKYELCLSEHLPVMEADEAGRERARMYLTEPRHIAQAAHVLEAMNRGLEAGTEDVNRYIAWKQAFQSCVRALWAECFL